MRLEKKFQLALDQKFQPIKQDREQKILQRIYKKFPKVNPKNDPGEDNWNQVKQLVVRFNPSNPSDPLSDIEERFGWAYERVFGAAPKANPAKMKQASYTGIGGGVSAAKSKTVEVEDKFAHLSKEARDYKKSIEASLAKDFEKDEELSKK